ncbi:ABC transporter substrate-binding protein [Haploplasma axanthum]|uniref:Glutathione-binding protein gsiB n=1 Tax=Haploplasma axanthum TaxID=29552 RepID=A0A449BC96_HAPAX|nr:ABC transporter substrate-binding protein [Haploplasma axanthum]VEU80069.1 Glutathione-binding protein gsiB precursor [Haploplasma axanthum]
MKKKLLSMIGLLLLVVLVACGKKGTDPDTLVVASGADPVTFDIQKTNDQATTRIARQIYETLIKQNDDLTLVPALALSWEDVGDNTYEFKLRQNVTFHNGEKFTAKDVEWTLKRASESSHIAHIVGTIDPEKIEIVDDYTIKIGTKGPFGPFLTHLAHPATAILNEKAVTDGGADYGTKSAVGTGPFKFVSWVSGDKVTLERYEDYHSEKAKMAKIEFRTITDASVKLIELETGGIDIAYDISPSDITKVEENDSLTLVKTANLGAEYLGLNLRNDTPLKNVGVRKAIAKAIDVGAIIRAIYLNVGERMSGPINELVFGFNDELTPYDYNLEEAKTLLAEAGFPNGGFSLKLYVGSNSTERVRVAQVIEAELKKIGITVILTQLEWGSFLSATEKGDADMYLLGWTTVTTDADYGLYPLFHSESTPSAGNRSFYSNERVDELLELGRTTSDPALRLTYYKEVQTIIHDELPWVFLQTRENVSGVRNNVKGFSHHPTGSYFLDGVSKEN